MGEGWGEGDNLHPSRHPKFVERLWQSRAPTSARPEPVEGRQSLRGAQRRGNLVAVAMAVRRRVLNRKPELPKHSGRNCNNTLNKRITAWSQADGQSTDAPYYIHQQGAGAPPLSVAANRFSLCHIFRPAPVSKMTNPRHLPRRGFVAIYAHRSGRVLSVPICQGGVSARVIRLSLRGAQRRGNLVEVEHVPGNHHCYGDEIATLRSQ